MSIEIGKTLNPSLKTVLEVLQLSCSFPFLHFASAFNSSSCQHPFSPRCSLRTRTCQCWRETTSARYVATSCLARRTSPPTCVVTTRSSHLQIPPTRPVRPRCTTAASAARCSPPSHPLTATCSSTLESGRFPVRFVTRLSHQMGICTATAGPTMT